LFGLDGFVLLFVASHMRRFLDHRHALGKELPDILRCCCLEVRNILPHLMISHSPLRLLPLLSIILLFPHHLFPPDCSLILETICILQIGDGPINVNLKMHLLLHFVILVLVLLLGCSAVCGTVGVNLRVGVVVG